VIRVSPWDVGPFSKTSCAAAIQRSGASRVYPRSPTSHFLSAGVLGSCHLATQVTGRTAQNGGRISARFYLRFGS
jgi:hypothetical protein